MHRLVIFRLFGLSILFFGAAYADTSHLTALCPLELSEKSDEATLILRLSKPDLLQVRERVKGLHWDKINETLFVLPHNDGESYRAAGILEMIRAPHVHLSEQKWGAKLGVEEISEKELHGIKRIVTFEMPGVEKELEFTGRGFEVVTIDHHIYQGLNRFNEKSSLEQMMDYMGWKSTMEDHWVALNDRAFVPGLKTAGLSPSEIRAVRKFDYLAQGNAWNFLKRNIQAAEVRASELAEKDGFFRIVDEDVAFVREELAIRSPNGVVNVFEIDRRNPAQGKMGFSGDPAVADMLVAFDYTQLGYEKGGFASYSVGSPPSKLYGFKATVPPAGERELLPKRVTDQIEKMLREKLGHK